MSTTVSYTHLDVDKGQGKGTAELMDARVSVAGRIVSRRIMGNASFCHILDEAGELQLYLRRDDVGTESYQGFKAMDIGDLIGVTGKVFTTKTGEISVHVEEITLLSKSLIPLPEKFHGLKDTDLRYRQRYVDLIVNPESRRVFRMRSQIIRAMRNYLDERGYMEVETPILQTAAGGASARPFVTHHNTLAVSYTHLPRAACLGAMRSAFSVTAGRDRPRGAAFAPP